MKLMLLLALTLMFLPVAAPVLASAKLTTLRPVQAGTVDRRSHHCNTPAQRLSARCRGV